VAARRTAPSPWCGAWLPASQASSASANKGVARWSESSRRRSRERAAIRPGAGDEAAHHDSQQRAASAEPGSRLTCAVCGSAANAANGAVRPARPRGRFQRTQIAPGLPASRAAQPAASARRSRARRGAHPTQNAGVCSCRGGLRPAHGRLPARVRGQRAVVEGVALWDAGPVYACVAREEEDSSCGSCCSGSRRCTYTVCTAYLSSCGRNNVTGCWEVFAPSRNRSRRLGRFRVASDARQR